MRVTTGRTDIMRPGGIVTAVVPADVADDLCQAADRAVCCLRVLITRYRFSPDDRAAIEADIRYGGDAIHRAFETGDGGGDDSQLVTVEWAATQREFSPDGYTRPWYSHSRANIVVREDGVHLPDWHIPRMTRGDMRTLCRILGVSLTPRTLHGEQAQEGEVPK